MKELLDRPVSILLVDDDFERASLARRIERSSPRFQVRHVLRLADALEILDHEAVDIVLCDFELGEDVDARQLLDFVARREHSARVIVFSGYQEGEHKKEVLEAGAFGFLAKPLFFPELLHAINNIEAFRKERELSTISARLAQISNRFHATLDLEEVTRNAVEAATELGFRRARLYLVDQNHKNLIGHAQMGMSPDSSFVGYRIPFSGSGLIDEIFDRKVPTAWSLLESQEFCLPADLRWIEDVGLEQVTWLDCPLLVGDKRVGTLAMDCLGAMDPSITPLQKETAGVLAGMVAQAVNNCRLYRAEALARGSLLQLLLEAPDAVVRTTLDGTIDFVSPSAEAILGLASSHLMRRKAADIYCDENGSSGSGLEIAKDVMASLKEAGKVNNRRVFVKSLDGRPLPVSLSASMLHESNGEPIGTLGILKSLGYLEQQFDEYRNLLEGFGYGMVVLDDRGAIRYVNHKAERLLGQDRNALQERLLSTFVRSKDSEGLIELEKLREGAVLQTTARETSIPLELSVSPIMNGKRIQGHVIGLYDRREQERLIWTGRLAALGETVGALAHEINNPLNIIQAATEMLEGVHLARDQDRVALECLATLRHGVDRVAALVTRLKRLSRPSSANRVSLDLGKLTRDMLFFFSRRLVAANIELKISLLEDIPPIVGDPAELEQILTSLVVNAEEAMSAAAKKQLLVELRLIQEKTILLVLEDSGPGVAKEHREEIFDLFFTTKAKFGTGFGLSLSRAIAREHGGELRLGNGEQLGGARFELELPVYQP